MNTGSRLSAYDAAVYLTNRHNSGAWPTTLPSLTIEEISEYALHFVNEDEMCVRRALSGIDNTEPFLTSEDINAMGILALSGQLPLESPLIGHDLMSESLTIEIIRAINADETIPLSTRRSLLYRTHSRGHTTDAILAALHETDPTAPYILTNPNVGPATVTAWLTNPNRHQHLTPEEIICLLNQDGIPEEDYLALEAKLLTFPDERLAEMESFWQHELEYYTAEIMDENFRYAHLISNELRSRFTVIAALT